MTATFACRYCMTLVTEKRHQQTIHYATCKQCRDRHKRYKELLDKLSTGSLLSGAEATELNKILDEYKQIAYLGGKIPGDVIL